MSVRLIIDGQLCDIDNNVSISINDSIQNAKEPDKVFGSYSNTFLLPATSINSKVFGKWETAANLSGWDARYAVDAEIQIDGATWRRGKVRLLSASTKNGKAIDYKVAFTGKIATLKDIIKDETLEQLDLSAYDHLYNEATVRTGLTTSLSSGVVRYPLITHTTRYFYTTQFEDAGGAALDYRELKPAVALTAIMDAIEARYSGITWASGGFWDDTDIFSSLYIWCHRSAGNITGGTELQTVNVPFSEWTYSTGTNVLPITTFAESNGVPVSPVEFDISYTVTPADSSLYNALIVDSVTGVELQRWENESGAQTFTTTVSSTPSRTWEPRLEIQTTDGLASFTVALQLVEREIVFGSPATATGNYVSTTTTFNLDGFMRIQSQIPKMKIIDFLTGLFKMFNLTAYFNNDDEIVVQTLDDFYASGTTWDLTRFLDVDYSVERIAPYSQINFKFADKTTKLAIKWDELFSTNQTTDYGINRKYGELSYLDVEQKFDGGEYSIEVPFEKMLFERLFTSSNVASDLQIGWAVDEDDDPSVGKPLVLVIENQSCNTTPIRWVGASNSTAFNCPNNTKRAATDQSINFNAEIDSFDLDIEYSTLFSNYWATYIGELYSKQSRKYSMTGYLPINFIQNYSLSDEVRAYGMRFRVESLKIELNTGKSTIELRNIPNEANR